MAKKVLFVSHGADRSGAPLMLLNVLRWLHANSRLKFEVLLRRSGPLHDEFASVAPTRLYSCSAERPPGFLLRNWRRHGLGRYPDEQYRRELLSHFDSAEIDVIYSNTITNGEILEFLAPLNRPVITHVHELGYWIERAGSENLEWVLKHTDRFVAASAAVKRHLVDHCLVAAEHIEVIHSVIPTQVPSADGSGVRRQLAIPQDAFVVVGAGYEFWRKGKELFVMLAALVGKVLSGRPVHFLWVGGWGGPEDKRHIEYDARRLGLADLVHFVGEVQNPADYFSAGDVFAMTSREDPFPLVCLEAAALGKPTICFDGAGGIPEFVQSDAGVVVPYLDLNAMATAIAALANDVEIRTRMGRAAAERVRACHDIEIGARKIEAGINLFGEPRAGSST